MQIEFERLVQLANPDFVIDDKIDSDTIFYFLNAYQERWIKQNYVTLDQVKDSTETLHRTMDAFKSLIITVTLNNGYSLPDYSYATRFQLPNNSANKFYLYLRSESQVSGTYLNISGTTINTNIDTNSALEVESINVVPVNSNYMSSTDCLPSYVVPSTYSGNNEGPLYVSATQQIVFYYHGNLYFNWEANCKFKQSSAYIDVNSESVTGTSNQPIKGQIYKQLVNNSYVYYDSNFNQITVASTTVSKLVNVPNKLITQDEVEKVLVSYFNKPILRQPCVILDSDVGKSNYITIYTDSYTNVYSCTITYIRKPRRFNVINPNNDSDIVDECELADNVHQEIVEGAVDMFIREGAYRLHSDSQQNNNQQNS